MKSLSKILKKLKGLKKLNLIFIITLIFIILIFLDQKILNKLGNVFTIIGLMVAIIIYAHWVSDYRLQKAHEYSLDLLKKIKKLHLEIEVLRKPRFINNENIIEDINKVDIPHFEEKIVKKHLEITSDLLVAEKILVEHNDLQSQFNKLIVSDVIGDINKAIYEFQRTDEIKIKEKIEETKLFKILYPSEFAEEYKESNLFGKGYEIVNDGFNEKIEKNFDKIYKKLEGNLKLNKNFFKF